MRGGPGPPVDVGRSDVAVLPACSSRSPPGGFRVCEQVEAALEALKRRSLALVAATSPALCGTVGLGCAAANDVAAHAVGFIAEFVRHVQRRGGVGVGGGDRELGAEVVEGESGKLSAVICWTATGSQARSTPKGNTQLPGSMRRAGSRSTERSDGRTPVRGGLSSPRRTASLLGHGRRARRPP